MSLFGDTAARWPRRFGAVTMRVARRFITERCAVVAACLSYTSLLALVPVLTVAMAVLSAFAVFDRIRQELQRWILENFAPHVGDQAMDIIASLVDNAAGLTAVGIVGIIITALALMMTIEDALNSIFRVERNRPLISRLIGFWTLLTVTPLLLAVVVSLSHSVLTPMIDDVALFVPMIGTLTPFLVALVLFTLLFIIVPHRHVAAADAIAGALIAAVGFETLKHGFAFYIAGGTYATIYGALVSIPLFLIWMYLSWIIVLIGALFADSLRDDDDIF